VGNSLYVSDANNTNGALDTEDIEAALDQLERVEHLEDFGD